MLFLLNVLPFLVLTMLIFFVFRSWKDARLLFLKLMHWIRHRKRNGHRVLLLRWWAVKKVMTMMERKKAQSLWCVLSHGGVIKWIHFSQAWTPSSARTRVRRVQWWLSIVQRVFHRIVPGRLVFRTGPWSLKFACKYCLRLQPIVSHLFSSCCSSCFSHVVAYVLIYFVWWLFVMFVKINEMLLIIQLSVQSVYKDNNFQNITIYGMQYKRNCNPVSMHWFP